MKPMNSYFKPRLELSIPITLILIVGAISLHFTSIKKQKMPTKIIKIACVGDSITYGAGMTNRKKNAYPMQLQALLDDNYYTVRNFGVNGRTLLKKGDYPYWETKEYKNALKFKPDIVYIKLGTNDSKKQNRAYYSEFKENYEELIDSFKKANGKARVVLLIPVPSYSKDSTQIWNPIIDKDIIPKIRDIAYKHNLEVIDLNQLFVDNPSLLPDTIHPSSIGANIIARRVYENVVLRTDTSIDFNSKSITSIEKHNFYGYKQMDFKFNNWSCKIVKPKVVAKGNPWVLRARFWGHEPQTDIALLERGFHIAFCDVSNLFGSDEAIKRWNAFYQLMLKEGLSKKVALEGMSRGGLIIYNWAVENPDKVACIYADAPVLDGKSWPGGLGTGQGSKHDWKNFKRVYKLNSKKSIENFSGNPMHKIKKIVDAKIPLFHVCGEADKVVPVDENTRLFEKEIKKLGGNITTIYKKGVGHHPHSLKNPIKIVRFIQRATGHSINFAVHIAPGFEYRLGAGWKKGSDWWKQAYDIDSLCMNTGKTDILLIGNSITQGFGGRRPNNTYKLGTEAIETYFKNLTIINAGISGDRTENIAWRIKNGHYQDCNPTNVVLTIGVNNFPYNTAAEIVKGIKLNVSLIKEKMPNAKILLLGPLPTGMKKNSNRRHKYNKVHKLISNLNKSPNEKYVNTIEHFIDANGNLNSDYYLGDGIHLIKNGYNTWAKLIRNNIQ